MVERRDDGHCHSRNQPKRESPNQLNALVRSRRPTVATILIIVVRCSVRTWKPGMEGLQKGTIWTPLEGYYYDFLSDIFKLSQRFTAVPHRRGIEHISHKLTFHFRPITPRTLVEGMRKRLFGVTRYAFIYRRETICIRALCSMGFSCFFNMEVSYFACKESRSRCIIQ